MPGAEHVPTAQRRTRGQGAASRDATVQPARLRYKSSNCTNGVISNHDEVSEGRGQDSHEDEGEDGKGGFTATSPGPCA